MNSSTNPSAMMKVVQVALFTLTFAMAQTNSGWSAAPTPKPPPATTHPGSAARPAALDVSDNPQSSGLRIIVETDAGGDPDDEQSLVRFLLYANEWDVEGIICNRPKARAGENLNPERTGLGIVQRFIRAYGECHPNLTKHDARYPSRMICCGKRCPGAPIAKLPWS